MDIGLPSPHLGGRGNLLSLAWVLHHADGTGVVDLQLAILDEAGYLLVHLRRILELPHHVGIAPFELIDSLELSLYLGISDLDLKLVLLDLFLRPSAFSRGLHEV